MLPHHVRVKEKYEFLEAFATLRISSNFHEQIANHFDPGSEQEIYKVTSTKDAEEIARYYPTDPEIFSELWNKILSINYKYWDLLEHIDIFVPNYKEHKTICAYIEQLRRKVNISGVDQGKRMIASYDPGHDQQSMLFKELVSNLFTIAGDNNFIVTIF